MSPHLVETCDFASTPLRASSEINIYHHISFVGRSGVHNSVYTLREAGRRLEFGAASVTQITSHVSVMYVSLMCGPSQQTSQR